LLEIIKHNDIILSIIVRSTYDSKGINFFTPGEFSQQLAFMKHSEGHVIQPHIHNPVLREVQFTKEVLFIRLGKVRVDFYDDNQEYIDSRTLNSGDVVLLAFGGHGFEILEDSEIIEVKQGPYVGEEDKTRFTPASKK